MLEIDRLDHLVLTVAQLAAHGVPLVEGPGDRTGASGPIRSVYVREPDGNLIEIANPVAA